MSEMASHLTWHSRNAISSLYESDIIAQYKLQQAGFGTTFPKPNFIINLWDAEVSEKDRSFIILHLHVGNQFWLFCLLIMQYNMPAHAAEMVIHLSKKEMSQHRCLLISLYRRDILLFLQREGSWLIHSTKNITQQHLRLYLTFTQTLQLIQWTFLVRKSESHILASTINKNGSKTINASSRHLLILSLPTIRTFSTFSTTLHPFLLL